MQWGDRRALRWRDDVLHAHICERRPTWPRQWRGGQAEPEKPLLRAVLIHAAAIHADDDVRVYVR